MDFFIKLVKEFFRIVNVVYICELRGSALHEDYVLPCWHPICL